MMARMVSKPFPVKLVIIPEICITRLSEIFEYFVAKISSLYNGKEGYLTSHSSQNDGKCGIGYNDGRNGNISPHLLH